jgi:DNA-binding NtrC family response regulator
VTTSILICEDDTELAQLMGEFLSDSCAASCVITHSLDEVIEHRAEALACALAILDVNLGRGRPSGVDVHAWLVREGYRGRTIFLTGHGAGHPLVAAAARTTGASVVSKPIAAETLAELAREAP